MSLERYLADHPRLAAWVALAVFAACVAVSGMEGAT
jgi:hypothetical protein